MHELPKLYMFDLDGVLIDSKRNMEASWNRCKITHGLEPSFADYFDHIGKPFEDILGAIGIENNYKEIYDTYGGASLDNQDLITIYPGVIETLRKLKDNDNKIAIVTSKHASRTMVMIKNLPKFDFVCSPRPGLRGKPAPDQLLFCMSMCNTDPQDAVYVGDMKVDHWAAQRANIKFIHANYGYGNVKCEISIDQIQQIISQ